MEQNQFNAKDGIKRRYLWAHHGTIVILNPTNAQTLIDVMVDTAISTRAVKVTPSRECTASIRLTDQATYTKKPM